MCSYCPTFTKVSTVARTMDDVRRIFVFRNPHLATSAGVFASPQTFDLLVYNPVLVSFYGYRFWG